jgi:phosphatidylglycerol:prolipoprotein diacylglycerol transferase
MFTHNLTPIAFSIGPLDIYYYSLVYILGFLLSILFLQVKRKSLNLTKDQVYDLAFYLMLGVIIGSRLYHVIVWEPAYYFSNPLKLFYLWEGGMAFHGGLIGGVVTAYLCKKKYKISFLKLLDIMTIPALIALALGRIANFINAETYGTVTNVSWCVDFGDNQCRHPVQIYAAIKRSIVAFIVYFSSKKRHKPGYLFFLTITLLGIGRFFIDFLRQDTLYLYLSVGQWSSLAMIIIGSYFIIKNRIKK